MRSQILSLCHSKNFFGDVKFLAFCSALCPHFKILWRLLPKPTNFAHKEFDLKFENENQPRCILVLNKTFVLGRENVTKFRNGMSNKLLRNTKNKFHICYGSWAILEKQCGGGEDDSNLLPTSNKEYS